MTESESKENRRQYPRFSSSICYRAASLFSARKPLVNISLGGIRIYSDDKFKLGKRLEIELLLLDDNVVKCTAKVVWQRPLPDGAKAKYDTGLQFLGIPADGLQILARALEQSSAFDDD